MIHILKIYFKSYVHFQELDDWTESHHDSFIDLYTKGNMMLLTLGSSAYYRCSNFMIRLSIAKLKGSKVYSTLEAVSNLHCYLKISNYILAVRRL